VLQIEPGSFFRTRFASFSEGGDGPNGVNLVQTPNQVQCCRSDLVRSSEPGSRVSRNAAAARNS
jgi:hypothetical protein